MAVMTTKKGIYINAVTCGQPLHHIKTPAAGTVFGFLSTGAATGLADGDEAFVVVDGQILEYHAIAANAIMGFQKVAAGLRFPVDDTNNDGIEISGGILAQDQSVFTIGTDGAFHIAARFDVSANTDYDVLMVGFRKVAAYQKIQAPADIDSLYDNFALFGVYDTGTPFTTLQITTDDDGAGQTLTNTTDVITATTPFELVVNVSSAGAVTYKKSLSANANPATAATLTAPTTTAAFTFDSGDSVTPCIIAVKGAANAVTLDLLKLDIGPGAL